MGKKFAPLKIQTPKEIIESQCDDLKSFTDGKIIEKLSSYNRPIKSYRMHGFNTVLSGVAKDLMDEDREVNIQENSGELYDKLTYEFFITSVKTPKYKYRVMFVQHGITFYPTLIVLDEAIALELKVKQETSTNNQDEFVELLGKVLIHSN